MKKNFPLRPLLCLALTESMLLSLAGCAEKHEHEWLDATCAEPKTCSECGATEGEPLGHDWIAATCEEPRTCQVCGKTRGQKLDHRWSDASCAEPAVCELCGETGDEPLGHDWLPASCTEPELCERCGESNGEPLGHEWLDANYQEAQRCERCGEIEGEPLEAEAEYYGVAPLNASDYPYASLDLYYEGTQSYIPAEILVLKYETFGSDVDHPAREGCEWLSITLSLTFYSIDTMESLPAFWILLDDYYCSTAFCDGAAISSEDESPRYVTAPVSWYGEEYITYTDYYATAGEISDNSVVFTRCVCVPVGYNGILFGITNYATYSSILDEFDTASCVLYRLD